MAVGQAGSSSVLEARNIIRTQRSPLGTVLVRMNLECKLKCRPVLHFTNEGENQKLKEVQLLT